MQDTYKSTLATRSQYEVSLLGRQQENLLLPARIFRACVLIRVKVAQRVELELHAVLGPVTERDAVEQ